MLIDNAISEARRHPTYENIIYMFECIFRHVPIDTFHKFVNNVGAAKNKAHEITVFANQYRKHYHVKECFKECSKITDKHMIF